MNLGIDIGSRFTKLAYLAGSELVLEKFDSAHFYRDFGQNNNGVFAISWKKLGLSDDIKAMATGYGRERAKLAGAQEISEIQAHSIGAQHFWNIETFTLADLGGQDVKVVRIENGKIIDFHASDRCAASTGRFLENMMKVLDIDEEELSKYWKNPAELSSTCAVFAETELLEKISQGVPIERLVAGVNYSVVKKLVPLIKHFPLDTVIATGGVANNVAVIKLINNELGILLKVNSEAQFAGAIGCLLVSQNMTLD